MTDENVNLINPKTEVRKGSHQEPKESPHPFQEWGLFSYVFLMVALLIYFLAAFCPQRIPAPSQSGALSQVDSNNTQSHYVWSDIAYPLGKKVEIDFDLRLLLLVFLAGGLGSTIHLATSLGDFIGNNDFKKSWTIWYLLRPLIGGNLGIILYLLLRGGLIAIQFDNTAEITNLNPYTLMALSALAGMFSKQVIDKCRELMDLLFRTAKGVDDREDKLIAERSMRETARPNPPIEKTTPAENETKDTPSKVE